MGRVKYVYIYSCCGILILDLGWCCWYYCNSSFGGFWYIVTIRKNKRSWWPHGVKTKDHDDPTARLSVYLSWWFVTNFFLLLLSLNTFFLFMYFKAPIAKLLITPHFYKTELVIPDVFFSNVNFTSLLHFWYEHKYSTVPLVNDWL